MEELLSIAERFGVTVVLLGALAWHHLHTLKQHRKELMAVREGHKEEVAALTARNQALVESRQEVALAMVSERNALLHRYERSMGAQTEVTRQIVLSMEARADDRTY